MTFSRIALLLAMYLGSTAAWAGACCLGAASVTPMILGECENSGIGMTVLAQDSTKRWDSQGKVVPSSLNERALQTRMLVGFRSSRRLQYSMSVPFHFISKSTELLEENGRGFGDMQLGLMWDPMEEKPASVGGKPTPFFTLGARIPTGRDWTGSRKNLGADVTGRGNWAAQGGLGMERTIGKWPWTVLVSGEAERNEKELVPALRLWANGGRYLGSRWSISASVLHEHRWAGQNADATARTLLSSTIVYNKPVSWRAWLSFGGDLPIDGMGTEISIQKQLMLGTSRIW